MAQDKFAIDSHKLFWHLDRVAAWQKNRLIVPIYLEISPVSYCNHACVFCGLDFAHNEHLILNAGTLMDRIDQMARLGVKSIMFAGEGEPLLHPQLTDIVQHTNKSGIDVSITTNGMNGNYQLWNNILPSLKWLRFSIDAAGPETYASVHGVSGTCFNRTLSSLRNALEIKKLKNLPVTIGVQFLMIRQNLADIEKAIGCYEEMGVDYLSFKPYSEHPQMLNKSGFTYTCEMIEAVDKIVGMRSENSKIPIIYRKRATQAYAKGIHKYSSCCAIPFWGYVSSKGDFYTCSVYLNDERFKVGNIYSDDMNSIFSGQRRKKSIDYAEYELDLGQECRLNCRMARINEFLDFLKQKPEHINFI